MSFNLSPPELALGILLCLPIYIATQNGRHIRRWLREILKQKRGPHSLKPKSQADWPL